MIYFTLSSVFFKIGLFSFGGGMAMLPLIYQTVKQFGFMSADEFANLVGIAQVTPGPIAVNAATYVGFSSAGIPGALAATFGVALPSFALVMIVSSFLKKFKENKQIQGAFLGIRPATVGLIASAAVFIGETSLVEIPESGIRAATQLLQSVNIIPCIICLVSLVLVGKFKVNPIWLILIMGAAGALIYGVIL